MSADKPLTDAQERVLIKLVENDDKVQEGMLTSVGSRSVPHATVRVLEGLGLIEVYQDSGGTFACPTAEGRAMLASMGD